MQDKSKKKKKLAYRKGHCNTTVVNSDAWNEVPVSGHHNVFVLITI